jgi:peroxiredoxin
MRSIITTLFVLLTVDVSLAGKFNKTLNVGDTAPSWANLEGTDGKKHSLSDLKDKDYLVVVFTCNSCPVAVAYEDRILEFAKANPKVGIVAINVNTATADALPAMKERATKKKFTFDYLYDPSQEIARKYGATYTPEFFVLNAERKVVYMGAMDDKAAPGTPKVKFLDDAFAAIIVGKTPEITESSASSGCRIKYNPKKKDD